MASASFQTPSVSMASTSSQIPTSSLASAMNSTVASTSSKTPTSSVSYLKLPSTSETSFSSAPPSSPLPWDVFLSFRGSDTRNKFTSHLYQRLDDYGIRTFRDDLGLRTGDVFPDALIRAIEESKTYVVVFSENYASSSWCLKELVKIYDCYKNMKRLIVGVYYNIEASVVRYQTGSFKKAFKKHKSRAKIGFFRRASGENRSRSAALLEEVKNWRLTLEEVADLSGQPVPAYKSEADIITEIVDRILCEINPKTLRVAKYPVGLDSRIEDVTSLFCSGTEGVIKIGIYGMGGVGKTTLAKAVYNHNYNSFQGSCFLANVREVSREKGGIVRLQQQLINDVLKCKNFNVDNEGQGIELITARICSTKVLIVIDDLDDTRPLEFLEGPFNLGSIIIITTRNEDVLDSIRVERRYKVNELGDAESSQLFIHHALGNSIIPDTLKGLSKEILKRAGGLPLALTAFGLKLLNDETDVGWRWFIDILKRESNKDVEESLLISFDALEFVDPKMQSIFLDIACFFIGLEQEEVVKILNTFYTFVDRNIAILKKRSLLKINSRFKLEMHRLLSDMGRKIVRNNSPEPRKHSRLWVSEDICKVLNENKGTELEIEGIIPHNLYSQNTLIEGVSFATEAFKRMSRLRFLYLNNVTLTGSFEQTFEDLRWLCWDFCPLKCLPSEFHPQKLVILALRRSKMRTMWEVSQVFENLKTLNMSYSLDLTTTPDFTNLQYLETLNLEGCKSLVEVHISIGSLKRLVSLILRDCVELRSLGETICDLKALKVLDIGYCQNLEALPTNLGNIESLEELNAEGTTVSKLPNSIGRLSKLVALRLSCSGLTEIHGLEELTSIMTLHLGGCNSSLVACTLSERFFQIYSKFGQKINIYTAEFPDWISRTLGSTVSQVNNVTGEPCLQSTVSLELLPNSHNFLGMILCFKPCETDSITYSVKNTTSDFIWSDESDNSHRKPVMVIVPSSIFLVGDGDNRIELTANTEIYGIHLLYKMTEDSTATHVEEVYPLKRPMKLQESYKN